MPETAILWLKERNIYFSQQRANKCEKNLCNMQMDYGYESKSLLHEVGNEPLTAPRRHYL